MDENTNIESAEMQEVAEPAEDALEGAEEQEVAEPDEAEDFTEEEAEEPSGRTEADARFAEMRRQLESLQRENKMMHGALGRYFDGETAEELSINANAYAEDRDPDEYREAWEHNRQFEEMQAENAGLKEQLLNMEVDRLMREGLRDIQVIDPNVKSLEDLGESFGRFIAAGLSSTEAYWACKAQENREKVQPPGAIGRVDDSHAEREYFTSEELDNLTDEQLDDPVIWEKAQRSLKML
jgi:hypothetical protein